MAKGIREIVVISGKGGTGKTSLTAAFAQLASECVVADCDVDAADLHLVLTPTSERCLPEAIETGFLAVAAPTGCTLCGKCVSLCRFDALRLDGSGPAVSVHRCEGCGVCEYVCPEGVLSLRPKVSGHILTLNTRYGPLVSGRLDLGQGNSGKLVTTVRERAARIAATDGRGLIITDGPPGIGCPVMASLAGVSAAVVVTEPTVSGLHDLSRILGLCKHFGVRGLVVVNKWDLNPDYAQRAEELAVDLGFAGAGRIPYSSEFVAALIKGLTVLENNPKGNVAEQVTHVWETVAHATSIGRQTQ